jgi:hypothetical protein
MPAQDDKVPTAAAAAEAERQPEGEGDTVGLNDEGDDDDDDDVPSILPPVTDAIREEYEREQTLIREGAASKDKHRHVCGIPCMLMGALLVLVGLVIAGTVLAVIYYDPNSGIKPPSESPSAAPSSSSDGADP